MQPVQLGEGRLGVGSPGVEEAAEEEAVEHERGPEHGLGVQRVAVEHLQGVPLPVPLHVPPPQPELLDVHLLQGPHLLAVVALQPLQLLTRALHHLAAFLNSTLQLHNLVLLDSRNVKQACQVALAHLAEGGE